MVPPENRVALTGELSPGPGGHAAERRRQDVKMVGMVPRGALDANPEK